MKKIDIERELYVLRKYLQIGCNLIAGILVISSFFMGINKALYASGIEGIQVYQKNLHVSPEHKQMLAEDISRFHQADNLWDVLRQEFSLPHYEDNPCVQEQIAWLMNHQDFLLRSATRSAPYLFFILQQVRKRHLPAELVLLPIIESGYNPFAYSTAGATGIWQMMPGTASGFGIKQDWWYDGRRDVIASTRAALNYLTYLQNFFDGNWTLAVAAYNCGEGCVLSSIRKNVRNGENTDFWSLPLPPETRDYVPRLLALAVIIMHPDQYPIYFPVVHNAPYLAQVDVGRQINLKQAASFAGISYKKLMQLNSGFNQTSTSPHLPYKLVLPIQNVESFTENLARSARQNSIDWIRYKVKPRDTLASIAKQFYTTPTTLRNLNKLASNHLKLHSILLIPGPPSPQLEEDVETHAEDVAEKNIGKYKAAQDEVVTVTNKDLISKETLVAFQEDIKASSGKYSIHAGDTVYMARAHDTWASIAKRFHISMKALRLVNKLPHDRISSGAQMVIPTHLSQTNLISSQEKLSPGDTVYMVRKDDTLEKIASKFHTSAAAIRVANLLKSSQVQEGDQIVIPTHIASG